MHVLLVPDEKSQSAEALEPSLEHANAMLYPYANIGELSVESTRRGAQCVGGKVQRNI